MHKNIIWKLCMLSKILQCWEQKISKNRKILKSMVKTVILCGRQGFALRSNHDSWKHLNKEPRINRGNFMALLEFRVLN